MSSLYTFYLIQALSDDSRTLKLACESFVMLPGTCLYEGDFEHLVNENCPPFSITKCLFFISQGLDEGSASGHSLLTHFSIPNPNRPSFTSSSQGERQTSVLSVIFFRDHFVSRNEPRFLHSFTQYSTHLEM